MSFMPDTKLNLDQDTAPDERYRRLLIAAMELKQEIRAAAVARMISVSEQTMTNWKARGVPDKEILRLSRIIGCNPFWLETGEGDMELIVPGVSKEALEIAKAYENLSAEKRAAYRVLLHQDDQHDDNTIAPLKTETERKRYSQ